MPDVDPSTLSDEELDKLIQGDTTEETEGEEAEGTDPKDADPKEDDETTEEVETDETTEGDEVEEPETPVTPPSRREQLRIQQLLGKMGKKSDDSHQAIDPSKSLNYAEELDADPEIIKRLEADRQSTADTSYKRAETMARTMQWETMLNIDAPQIETKYDMLNPKDTEHFHPAIADSLSKWYLNQVGYDADTKSVQTPGVRWSDFVDGVMELADEIAASKVATATKNIKSQAAKTGLRPDGSSTKKLNLNRAPEAMTDEELDAMIATAIPNRR